MSTRQASKLSALVGDELRAQGARRRWVWTDIEKATGITHGTMNRMLFGRTEITIERLLLICAATQTNPHALIESAVEAAPAYLEEITGVPQDGAKVTVIPRHEWANYTGAWAADNDAEADTPEPDHP